MLNARGHRSGDREQAASPWRTGRSSAQRPRASERRSGATVALDGHAFAGCSTPEGIGAEIGRSRQPSRSTGQGAQRPRASERRSGIRLLLGCARTPKCSTPEGIGAEIGALGVHVERVVVVLNARGHRSGDRTAARPRAAAPATGDRLAGLYTETDPARCSTPEGIGAEIGREATRGRRGRAVLNARGHRSGDRVRCERPAAARSGAQRPRASERRSASDRDQSLDRRAGAQRPRASERRSGPNHRVLHERVFRCSTPEGIGAEIGRSISAERPGLRACAQRPRASERRSAMG